MFPGDMCPGVNSALWISIRKSVVFCIPRTSPAPLCTRRTLLYCQTPGRPDGCCFVSFYVIQLMRLAASNPDHTSVCFSPSSARRRSKPAFTPDTCSRIQVSRTSNLYPSTRRRIQVLRKCFTRGCKWIGLHGAVTTILSPIQDTWDLDCHWNGLPTGFGLPTRLQPDCLHGLRTTLRYVLVLPLSSFS